MFRDILNTRIPLLLEQKFPDILSKAEYVVSISIRFTVDAKYAIASLSKGFPYFTHLLGKEALLMAFRRMSPTIVLRGEVRLQWSITFVA